MPCLNATITQSNSIMSFNVALVNESLFTNVTKKDNDMSIKLSVVCDIPFANIMRSTKPMSLSVTKPHPNLFTIVTKKENDMSIKLSIVCSLSKVVEYLRVSPSDIQWITDDIGVFFDVESNVKWIVTTD